MERSISVRWLAEIESSFKPPLLNSPISQHLFFKKNRAELFPEFEEPLRFPDAI